MSVLIKGLKLPKDGVIKVAIRGDDGIASVYLDDGKADYYSVIELPDHGDLIDESETVEAQYYDDEHEEWLIKTKTVGDVLAEICEVPPKVVIPAEREEASICDNCDERSDVGCSWCKRMEKSEDDSRENELISICSQKGVAWDDEAFYNELRKKQETK